MSNKDSTQWLSFGKSASLCAYALPILLFALAQLDRDPYDDAYFFKRFAVNLLDHGLLAWNVDEGPVYGSTSQLFQWLAVPITALARDYYTLATRILAGVTLLLAFINMRMLTRPYDGGSSAAYAFCSPILLYPLLSGMETALALLLLVLFLLVTLGPRARDLPWWLAPTLVAAIYAARPDATLLALPLLLLSCWERGPRARREWLLFALLLLGMLLAFKLYYKTALPLPFYAKQSAFSPYDAHFRALALESRRARFGLFAACAAALYFVALARRDRLNLCLLGSASAFIAYHFFMTIDVMGMQGRFYVPATPWLIFAAARASESIVAMPRRKHWATLGAVCTALLFVALWRNEWLPPQEDGWPLEQVPRATLVALGLCALLFFLALAWPAARTPFIACMMLCTSVALALPLRASTLHIYSDADYLDLGTGRYTVYRGLDSLRACLGSGIHVYHSEVGLPGLRFLDGKVSDLAGLLSRKWLFRKKPFDRMCKKDAPEAIFLPHKLYQTLNAEILSGSCIRRYKRVVKRSNSPLYVRKDLYPRFFACASARHDPYLIVPKSALPVQ